MRGKFNRTIVSANSGAVVPYAMVDVFDQATGDRVDIYSSQTGGTPISNPFESTSLGFVSFFLDAGQYRFVARSAGGAFISEITHEVVVDPSIASGIYEVIEKTGTDENIDYKGISLRYLQMTNSSAKTLTFRPFSSFEISVGEVFNIRNSGAGLLTVIAGSGVTINPPTSGVLTIEKNGSAAVICIAENEYDMIGVAARDALIETWTSISSVTPTAAGQLFTLKQHTSGGLGGGTLMAFVGSVADDGGTQKNALGGFYLKRVDIENLSIEDFGGNGNGVFDNALVFGLIGSSGYKRVLIPDGKIFYTTGSFSSFDNIDWWGEGRVKTPTDTFPAKFAIVSADPTIVGPGLPNYFNGDSVYNSNQEYFIQKTGRYGLTQPYFASEGCPHFSIFDNRTGASGTDAHLAVAAPAGATSITLKYTNVGFPTGTVFVMDDGLGHSQQFTSTGTTGEFGVNFTPAVTGATFPIAPGFTTVKKANRTQEAFHHTEVYHNAGGDGYGQCWRIYAGYNQATTAQYHFFQTSTVGMWNGDIAATASGNYLQVSETNIADLGFDVAVIGEVRSYDRTNDTGNRYAFWADRFIKSEGSKKLNFGSIYVGLFDVVQDFGGVTGTDCMIGFAPTQKIYFNNGQNIIPGNPFPIGYGSKGNIFMGSDVSGTVWEVTNNSHKLKLSSTGALLTPGYVSAGSDIAVPVNKKISLNSSDDLTFFRYDGANVKLYKNNVVVATW